MENPLLLTILFVLSSNIFGQSSDSRKKLTLDLASEWVPLKYQIQDLAGGVCGIDTLFNGKLIGKNKNKKKIFELNVVNGVFNGEQKYYYTNEKLYERANFTNGVFVGDYITYYPNGQILAKNNYTKGSLNGLQMYYTQKGIIVLKDSFNNGIMYSEKLYNEFGNLKESYDAVNGNKIILEDLEDATVLWDEKFETIDSLQKENKEHTAILNVKVIVDTISIGSKKIPLNYTSDITIDKESDLLVFADSFGLKIFHIVATEYGQFKHYYRYDLFVKNSVCWKRQEIYSSLSEIYHYNPDSLPINASSCFLDGSKDIFNFRIAVARVR